MTLTEFLLARIAEDENEAREAAKEVGAEEWLVTEVPHEGAWFTTADATYIPSDAGGGWATDHATRWSPARVLAECEAKRQIVAMHDRDGDHCVMCSWEDPRGCPTLRALAAVYADHPDYRGEWKP